VVGSAARPGSRGAQRVTVPQLAEQRHIIRHSPLFVAHELVPERVPG